MLPRLERLCAQFRWSRMDEVFLGDEQALTRQVIALEPSDNPAEQASEALRDVPLRNSCAPPSHLD
ncbi:MAG: hypothetical protein ACR2RL_03470, partial [Gammaproteobacteria bacterium]